MLLDSVEIADPGEVRQTLAQELTSSIGIEPPAVLLPVLSIEDITMDDERRSTATAYVDFDPGQRIPMTPGSEAMVGQLIRDFVGDRGRREPSQGWIHPAAPIAELRDSKVRTLVLVTDVIGSGTQVARYAEAFTRNATIRSWRSFKLIRLLVLAYSATPGGAEFVRGCRAIDDLIYARPAPSFSSAPWMPKEREQVSELCRRYLPRRERRNALGFGDSAGLFATTNSVPNNLPGILRRVGKDWWPFFEGRTVPPDLVEELGRYRPVRAAADEARTLNQRRLARVIESGRLGARSDSLALVLAVLTSSRVTQGELAHKLGIDLAEASRLLDFLMRAGLVAEDGRVTARGSAESAMSKRLARSVTVDLPRSSEPYYPQALR